MNLKTRSSDFSIPASPERVEPPSPELSKQFEKEESEEEEAPMSKPSAFALLMMVDTDQLTP